MEHIGIPEPRNEPGGYDEIERTEEAREQLLKDMVAAATSAIVKVLKASAWGDYSSPFDKDAIEGGITDWVWEECPLDDGG